MAKIKKKEQINLLWTDEEGDQRKKLKEKSFDSSVIDPHQITLKIWIEKNKRGGKVVSIIKDMPHNPDYFQKLAKDLKKSCGTGGSYKNNTIEIQGDCRDKMKSYLERLGFSVKLAGG